MTRYTAEDFAKEDSPTARKLRGMIRRMAVSSTRSPIWRLAGHESIDESPDAEQFSGVGFYARPPAGGRPEAIIVATGGPRARVIVATRDEATRKTIADLAADETAVFTSAAIVVIRADGTVEIRSKNGTALALPTMADLEALRALYNSHTHTVPIVGAAGTTPSTAPLPIFAAGPSTGTVVLKAE